MRLPARLLPIAAFLLVALVVGAVAPAGATLEEPGLSEPVFPTEVPPAPLVAASQDPPEVRALWVDAFHDGFKTPGQVDELVDWARQANMNTLIVQVRRRGDAYYARGSEPRTEDPSLTPGFDALQYLLDRAHAGPRPLQVQAWLATLPAWHKRDTPPLAPNHVFNTRGLVDPANTWLMLRDDGAAWAGGDSGGVYYLDPGNPDAARYTVNVYLDVLRNYDVDGINLDHVRYFEGAGQDRRWGYNPTSVQRFNQKYGRDPATQPDPSDPAWMQWRRDQVTALVRRLYLEAKAIKPSVVVTASVVAWGQGPESEAAWQRAAPYSGVFQDWRTWLQQGIVDYVLPMDYYRESTVQAGWFDSWVRWQQGSRAGRGIAVGLGSYLNDAQETVAQITRARAEGPLGVALYSYAVPTNETSLDGAALRESALAALSQVFPRPAPVPALPWQATPTSGAVLVDVPGREGTLVRLLGASSFEWWTDGTGLAGSADVPPGAYSATVIAPGVDAAPLPVTVEAGRVTTVRYTGSLSAR